MLLLFKGLPPKKSTLPQITCERNPRPDGLTFRVRPTGVIDKPRHVPGEDDDDDGCLAKFPGPDASGIEVAGLEDERLIELERHLAGNACCANRAGPTHCTAN